MIHGRIVVLHFIGNERTTMGYFKKTFQWKRGCVKVVPYSIALEI